MLEYLLISWMVALIAAVLGFAVLGGFAAWVAKLLFFVSIVPLVVSLGALLLACRRQPRV